jgi:1,2-diacylglycerol 3-alpha-glucosyltransferase
MLEVAGRGPELSQLEKLCVDLQITNNVRFLGFLGHDELARCYARCNVFVLPSVVETQGLVAMEAMRFGKPVIVTSAIVSADELVTDGENGFIVDPNRPDELASRLLSLGANEELRRAMGMASVRRADSYQPDVVIPETEMAYRSVLR